ncbi:MAG: hypothetical protein IT162_19060 [Bryobacterales bacterium]|nr:hypothetical protein [Bryobacterales bacterium]
MLELIATLRRNNLALAVAFDVLAVELSKLFEEWKGRSDKKFVFGRPDTDNVLKVELNKRAPFRVAVAKSEVSGRVAAQLRTLHGWHWRTIASTEDAMAFVRLLATEIERCGSTPEPTLGLPYQDVDEDVEVAPREAFITDPSKVERGWKGHRVTQNRLANHLRSLGVEPKQPDGDVLYDLAWEIDGRSFVAEIKSISDANETGQMRLGLGQVLHYAHQLSQKRGGAKVVPVLVPEREPLAPEWQDVCAGLGVTLTWPADFQNTIRP